mgnify:CR=1 FL=1
MYGQICFAPTPLGRTCHALLLNVVYHRLHGLGVSHQKVLADGRHVAHTEVGDAQTSQVLDGRFNLQYGTQRRACHAPP